MLMKRPGQGFCVWDASIEMLVGPFKGRNKEILANGKYGYLVQVGNAEALAKGIEEALQASHDTDALISRAAEFSPSIAAQSYLKLVFDDA